MISKKGKILSVRDLPPRRFKGLSFRTLVDGNFLRQFSMYHMTLPKGRALPNVHHRRTEELIYCLDGSMTATVAGRTRRLKQGDLVYIPKGVWHKFETSDRACEALALFGPALSLDASADIHGEPGVTLWD